MLLHVDLPGLPCPTDAIAQATDVETRMRSWDEHLRLESESPFADFQWRAVGPKQAGARVEAIAVPPGNHGTIYVGVGSGNLWKTENNGLTWRPIFEKESTFTIGDVAVAPSDPDVVWVGSGETQPRHSGYSYAGTGVFKSIDAGATWRNMGLHDTHHIGKVIIHPDDPDIVYVAAIGHFWSRNEQRGVFRTVDGGTSWQQVLFVNDDTGAVDLAMDPSDPSIVYATMWQTVSGEAKTAGAESGIYKSSDGGVTWTRLSGGLPPGPLGRIGLDIAPSNPTVAYAFVDNWNEYTGEQDPERPREIIGGEVYRSDDRGESWRKVNEEDLYPVFRIYGWKFADIRVAPDNEDEIFILGLRAFYSADGGRTFQRIGEQIIRMHDTRGLIMHLDHHEIWIDPLNPDRVLLGNDGGLFQSWDRGKSWLHINNIPAAEFYSVSVDMAEPYRIYGGTQDNAALYGPSDAELQDATDDPWENVYLDRWTGGDSFDTYLDPTDSTIVYYEHQHGAMRRMDITGDSVLSGAAEGIRPRAPEDEEERWRFGWYTPFVISHHDPYALYVGGDRLFKSTNRGDEWEPISPDLSDPAGGQRAAVPFGTITMISESRLQPGLIYAGTEGGSVWLTRDDGTNWTKVSDVLPKKWVSRVIASEHAIGTVYVSQTGFREDDFGTYIFASEDFGENWKVIAGNLPVESINVVREDPFDAQVLYVGTDLGVYVTLDHGSTWHSLCANLPTTPVHDLIIHRRDGEIVIGTHGRSVFVADLAPIRERAQTENP
jgi:photosystem II stability/assembly factor-like uncharacterized protein